MATTLSTSTETARPDLADALVKFDLQANQGGFVGLEIAPPLEVAEAFGQYPVIEPGELLKSGVQTLRNSDGSYNFVGGRVGKDHWMTEEHGIGERVDRREAIMYRNWFDAEMLAAMRARDAVLRAHNDRVIAAAIDVPGGQSNAVSVSWKTVASSDPVADVRAAILRLRDNIGMVMGLAMVIDFETFQYLKDTESVLDRIKFAGIRDPERSSITVDAMQSIFSVDRIIVSTAVVNTAEEPNDAVFDKAWDPNNVLIFTRPITRDLRTPQYMRTFHWGADGSAIGGVMESYGDSSRRSDIVRVRMDTQEKKVYEGCAELLTGANA